MNMGSVTITQTNKPMNSYFSYSRSGNMLPLISINIALLLFCSSKLRESIGTSFNNVKVSLKYMLSRVCLALNVKDHLPEHN